MQEKNNHINNIHEDEKIKEEILKWINTNSINKLEERIIPDMVRPKKFMSKRVSLKSDFIEENIIENDDNKNKKFAKPNLPFKQGEGFCTRCLIF